MLALQSLPALRRFAAPVDNAAKRTYFFGPVTDFLLLGGLSLFLLPVVLLLPADAKGEVQIATAFLSLLINHPHFANSYQLFYRDFRRKAYGDEYSRILRLRYVFAGIAVPAALALFFVVNLVMGEMRTLALAANVMALFVGWHYVKQGYGMLVVSGALRRQYFDSHEKSVFLVNAYAVWLLTWISVNTGSYSKSLFGIEYRFFNFPAALETTAIGVTAVSSLAVIAVLLKKWASAGTLPWTGVAAYGVTLYLWTLFVRIDPLWILIVPALHSLQYLVVVWRYQLNRDASREDAFHDPHSRVSMPFVGKAYPAGFLRFVVSGIVLGLLGFYVLPLVLEVTISPHPAGSGISVFLFTFWVFINVHHYFIDNVSWRSDNPDIKRFLFSQSQGGRNSAPVSPSGSGA